MLHGKKPEKVKPTKAESNCYIALSGSLRLTLASLASLISLASFSSFVSLASLAPAGGEGNKQIFLCREPNRLTKTWYYIKA